MPDHQEFDIVVYGSTSAAVATSVQAARLGRTVALISPQQHIGETLFHKFDLALLLISTTGGIQINGLGATDIDNQAEFQNSTTLGGLNLELHQRISDHYGRRGRLDDVVLKKLKDPDVWRFESRVAEQVISEWLTEYPLITIIKVNFTRVTMILRILKRLCIACSSNIHEVQAPAGSRRRPGGKLYQINTLREPNAGFG